MLQDRHLNIAKLLRAFQLSHQDVEDRGQEDAEKGDAQHAGEDGDYEDADDHQRLR